MTANLPAVGDRVQLHPATDAWMMGDRFGVVVRVGRAPSVSVRMDRSGRTLRLAPCRVVTLDGASVFGGAR